MTARNYIAGAPLLTLSAGVTSGDVTLTVASTTGYPVAPFLIVLERATANEEVCLCTAKAGTTFTVTRGYDGTTAKAHLISTSLEHGTSAIDYNEANDHINNVANDHHTQYARKALWTAKGQVMAASAASTPAPVTVGADGSVLMADSTTGTGVKWATIGTTSVVDGSVSFAKLASAVQKNLLQSVAGFAGVASPAVGQEVYDSAIDRYMANMSVGGWTLRPHGIGKVWLSTGAPSGGLDGDCWMRYV